jgi:hypothetical protein
MDKFDPMTAKRGMLEELMRMAKEASMRSRFPDAFSKDEGDEGDEVPAQAMAMPHDTEDAEPGLPKADDDQAKPGGDEASPEMLLAIMQMMKGGGDEEEG